MISDRKALVLSLCYAVCFLALGLKPVQASHGEVAERAFLQHQEDTLITRELDMMVVSARRMPVYRSEAMRSVRVLDAAYIQNSPARDLAGLLGMVQSVDVRHRGAFGMQSDVSIRGGTFDQTLVLLNGVNVTDPQTGHHSLNVPLDVHSIERIEVLQGSGARVFGPNAFQGAINIITKEPGESKTGITLSGGQYVFGSAGVYSGYTTGRVAHHVSVNGMTSDGFTTNTDFRSGNVFYRSLIHQEAGRIDIQAGYNEKAFGANSFYTPRFPDQFEHTKTGFLSARWLPDKSLRLTPVVYWRRHHDRFELFRSGEPDWYSGHNFHQTDILGASLNWSHIWGSGTTSIGLDYRYEHINSNVLGMERNEPKRIRGEKHAFYTHTYDRSGVSLMLEHNMSMGPFSVSAGTLVYSNSDLNSPVTFFPGLDVGWSFSDGMQWFASFNRTLRLPTFTDLFYSGPDNTGNANLKPEEALSLETGIKGVWHNIRFDAALFRRWGTNMIDWVRKPEDTIWRSENLTRITLTGIEMAVRVPLGETFNSIQKRSLSLHYTYIHSEKESGSLISNYALDHLRHKLDIIWMQPVTRKGGITMTASWQDRDGDFLYYDRQQQTYSEVRSFEPFWMLDMTLFYRVGSVRVFSEASNVLDTAYSDIANVPQPGRWVRAGILLEFP